MNPQCTAIVLALNPDSVLREGLEFDRGDIAIVTDVDWEQHLGGEFDLYNRDKVFGVFRSAVDVILPGGTAVLNAADPMALEMKPLSQAGVILYATDPNLPALMEHHAAGQPVVTIEDKKVVGIRGDRKETLASLDSIDGVNSLLAAQAALWHLR